MKKLILLLVIIVGANQLKSQSMFEILDIDTLYVDGSMKGHTPTDFSIPDQKLKLHNHVDGNYTMYYFLSFPLEKRCEYVVMDNKIQGFIRFFDFKGRVVKLYYYSDGLLLAKGERNSRRKKMIWEFFDRWDNSH